MRYLKWFLAILIILQAPFLFKLFRSYQLSDYVAQLGTQREVQEAPFRDWRGAIHIHSATGGHSTGLYEEIFSAARDCTYDFVFITEHPRQNPILVQPQPSDLVVIYGFEKPMDSGPRMLTDPDGKIRIATEYEGHPIPSEIDALEIYNLHENGVRVDSWFNRINFLYHQLVFTELFYYQLWDVNPYFIQSWETSLADGHKTALAGSDAHQNVGIVLQTTTGQKLLSLMVDPYARSLRFVSNRLVDPKDGPLTSERVIDLIGRGSSYIAFEQIADPTGFSFHAEYQGKPHPMGSTVGREAKLVLQSPIPARFRVFRSGALDQELEGRLFEIEKLGEGCYRVEVYPLDPPVIIEGKPWILSNPIYVR
jgi:hypothetical protein